MEPGNILFKKITEDTDKFSLKGMVKPTLWNNGDAPVRILHRKIMPGEGFDAGAEGVVMQNSIPITFEGDENTVKDVTCYYVALVEVNESNCNN